MKMLQNVPKVTPYHFFMPHIRVADLMNDQDKAFISRVSQLHLEAKDGKLNFFDFHAKLKAMQNYLRDLREKEAASTADPIVINSGITVEGGAQSPMADRMGIADGETTDKLACVHWDTGKAIGDVLRGIVMSFKPAKKKAGNKLTSGQIAYNVKRLEALQMAETIKYDFEDILKTRLLNRGIEIPEVGKFLYFTSSPGQSKKGSGYMLNINMFKQYPYFAWPISCEEMNENCRGKAPVATKFMQYRALDLSTSVPSSSVVDGGVHLSKIICVPSVEKMMRAKVLSVSDNYETSEGVRSDISNDMFDGCGVLNARKFGEGLALQIRGHAACKGLLVSFDAVEYNNEMGYKNRIWDVDGVAHDLETEDWDAIITPDVWKTQKLFPGGSWKAYVETCESVGLDELYVTGTNHPETKKKALSNQMSQTLFEIWDDEIPKLAERSIASLHKFDSPETAWSMLAAPERDGRTPFETLCYNYHSVMNTAYVRDELTERKHSAYHKVMQGKYEADAMYGYVCPDLCAFCDVVCGNMPNDDPSLGVLKAHEVVCGICPEGTKEIVLERSPACFFEHVPARVVKSKWLPTTNIVFVSVHDLNYRVLQMDYDGDHLLVVWDKTIIEVVKRTWARGDVNVLYYEPTNGEAPKAIPSSRTDFNRWICDSLSGTARTNKVGIYSTYQKTLWSLIGQKPMDELLTDAAKIAAGVNHAVDAAKTGSMTPLPESLMAKYSETPYFARYKKKVAKRIGNKTLYEIDPFDPYWDGVDENGEQTGYPKTSRRGSGVIDRVDRYIETQVSYELELDTSKMRFSWSMMASHDPRFCVAERKAVVNKKLAEELQEFGPIKANVGSTSTPNTRLMASAVNGENIGVLDLFNLLCSQKAAFFNAVDAAQEDEGIDEYESEKARRFDNVGRIEFIRNAIVAFMKNMKLDGYTDEELLKLAANWILRRTWRSASDAYAKLDEEDSNARALKSEEDPALLLRVRRIFDIFGDIYAENVTKNRAEGYVPQHRLEWVDTSGNVFLPKVLGGTEDDAFSPEMEDCIFSLPEASDEDLLEQIPEDSTRYDEMDFPESL